MSDAVGTVVRPLAAKSLIGGDWRASERNVAIRDPYRGDVVGMVPVLSLGDVEAAVTAAV